MWVAAKAFEDRPMLGEMKLYDRPHMTIEPTEPTPLSGLID